ncbi:MAG: hypothetical protein GXO76_11110 [Calditrichaeota bacterium]|nr:hypothetical protein [Calditrichota bacterium]
MNIYSLPAVIAFTINFSLAVLVFLDNPQDSLKRWFSGFVLIFAIWNFSEIIILNSPQYEKALLGAQILYRALFLAPAFFLIISYLFPKPNRKFQQNGWLEGLILALPILALVVSFPNFTVELQPLTAFKNIYYYRIKIALTPAFLFLLTIAFTYMGWGTINLMKKLKKARTNRERNQIRFLLVGVLSIFLIYILVNAFHSYYSKLFSFYFFSTLLTLFVSFFFFAAIMQYKILRISRIITGGLTYSLLSSLILAVYFLIVRGLSESLGQLFQLNSFLFEAFLILLLILLIRPFEARIQHFIDRLLYKQIYTYRRKFLDFSRDLLVYHSRNTFFKKLVRFIQNVFKTRQVLIFLKDENSGYYKLWNRKLNAPPLPEHNPLVKHLTRAQSGVEFFDLDHKNIPNALIDFLSSQKASLFLPLIYETNLLGFMVLSEKTNQKTYSQEEIEVLSIFSNEMANTFIRNQMIDEMREEERQQSRMQRLAAIGQLTAGVAHEIRNPLNTIATSAETLIKRKLDPESENELKSYILEEANRLNRILNDFLKLSRIRKPELLEISIESFLEKIALDIQTRIDESISFQVENHLRRKRLTIDPDLLHQVLLNLSLNGIDAIRERQKNEPSLHGMLKIHLRKRKSNLVIVVEDNGSGIPEEYQGRIFDPFFTTKPEGTGLGLPISYNIVETMGGKMGFDSTTEGSRFFVEFPIFSGKS